MLRKLIVIIAIAPLFGSLGCVVPQPRGEGQYMHIQEPTSKAWYHLYLPVDYVKSGGRHPNPKMKKWPLVMTFHGMKPYDNALPQEREWEKQADIYGYIVCAPQLETSDSFMEYPLTQEHDYVLQDRRNVIAIMDHIFYTTHADPKRVLSTSWSCGGYLAHYFPNRYPDRFAAIATRLSNFSSKLMIEESVPYYRERIPVAVFIGDGDFPACKSESEEAVAWYQARGFRVVRGKMIDNMGHKRIPQTAAAFFAEQIGLEPLRPLEAAQTVAQVQMTEYHPPQALIARLSPPAGTALAAQTLPKETRMLADGRRSTPSAGTGQAPMTPPVVPPTARPLPAQSASNPSRQTPAFVAYNAGRGYPHDRRPTYDPNPEQEQTVQPAAQSPVTPSSTLASADRPKTWLDPNGPSEHQAPAAKSNTVSPPQDNKAAPVRPAPGPTPSVTNSSPSQSPAKPAAPSADRTAEKPKSQNPRPADRPTVQPPTQLAAAKASPQFSPQNAGRRDYDRLMDIRPTDQPSATQSSPSTRLTGTAGAVRSKAQRVNIRISGPAIGTAPHYLRYSVDLPREKLEGADVLWMDNGVWLGDDPSGSRLLESPGLHFITVLVVAEDGMEYRGQAKVQVLERAPTAANFNAAPQPG